MEHCGWAGSGCCGSVGSSSTVGGGRHGVLPSFDALSDSLRNRVARSSLWMKTPTMGLLSATKGRLLHRFARTGDPSALVKLFYRTAPELLRVGLEDHSVALSRVAVVAPRYFNAMSVPNGSICATIGSP